MKNSMGKYIQYFAILIITLLSIGWASVRYAPKYDWFSRLRMDADSAYIAIIDTTVPWSVQDAAVINLYDPEINWSYDALRAAEDATSLVITDAKRLPSLGVAFTSTAGDSVTIADVLSGTVVRRYLKASSNVIGNVNTNDVSWKDGVLWLAQAETLTKIDELQDLSRQWTTSGEYLYNARLTSRNAASGYTLMSSSPAIVNNDIRAIDAIRSPWAARLPGHRDVLGRALQYWGVNTAGGSSKTVLDVNGGLSIYDSNIAAYTNSMFCLGMQDFRIYNLPNLNMLLWLSSVLRLQGDNWAQDTYWSHSDGGTTGSEQLRWPISTTFSTVAALDAASNSGNSSPRVYVGADSGLYVLDAKVEDNTHGTKQEITSAYVDPPLIGDVVMAISSASTAARGNIAGIFSTAETAVTRSATANGPLSHSWAFNGTTSVSRIPDHDSLSFTSGMPFSVYFNVLKSSANEQILFIKANASSSLIEYEAFFTVDKLYFLIYTAPNNYIGRYWNVAFPEDSWKFVVLTFDGVSTITINVNGVRVDNTNATEGSFTGMTNTTSPLLIGAKTSAAGNYEYFTSSTLTPPVFVRGVLTQQQIDDLYKRFLDNIQSPTNDVLTGASVLSLDTNPYTQQVLLTTSANRAELRTKGGALLDTFACSSCGTFSDAKFLRALGADSLGGGIFIGGSTGSRIIVPDIRQIDMAGHRYEYEPYEIGDPAVVDSSGAGDFWAIPDGLAALNVVGLKEILVRAGTYASPITTFPAGMQVRGQGVKTLITNSGSTSDEPVTIANDSTRLEQVAVRSLTGGAGGNQDAILVSGNFNILVDVTVIDADDDAIAVTGAYNRLRGVSVLDADDRGLDLNGGNGSVVQSRFSSGGSECVVGSSGDEFMLNGNNIEGHLFISSGGDNGLANDNRIEGTLSNWGTGNTTADNEQ